MKKQIFVLVAVISLGVEVLASCPTGAAAVNCAVKVKGPFLYDQHLQFIETCSPGSDFYSARSSDSKISLGASFINNPVDDAIVIAINYDVDGGSAGGVFDLGSKANPSLSLTLKQ